MEVAMDMLECWRWQECGMCVRKAAVNKWSKPGRQARWKADGKAEKVPTMPFGVHFMQSHSPLSGP